MSEEESRRTPSAADPLLAQTMSADHLLLNDYLQQLVGQPFLFFQGSEGLTLHLGRLEQSTRRTRRGKRKGSYILAARGSRWRVREANLPLLPQPAGPDVPPLCPTEFRPLPAGQAKRRALVKPGEQVAAVRTMPRSQGSVAAGFELLLVFAGGSSFLVTPLLAEVGPRSLPWEDDVPDWELAIPQGGRLRIGPGAAWAYLPPGGQDAGGEPR